MITGSNPLDESTLDKALHLQNRLVAHATGGSFEGADREYHKLRRFFGSRADTKTKLPDSMRCRRDLSQFWGWIKYERFTYAAGRAFADYAMDRRN
jgi:hypothetical protein